MDSIYERALFQIGSNGPFQKKFDLVYNCIFAALWAMTYNNIVLALVVIPHICDVSKLYSEKSVDNNGVTFFNVSVNSNCLVTVNKDEKNATKVCDSFIYNQTWFESTIPSSNDWVCDDEINVANVFAYSKIGEVLGSVVFGWFGDIYGRRLTFILSLGMLLFGRMISILACHSYTLFVIGCIIAWIPSWSAVQSLTVISMEISSQERRSLTATYRMIAYSTGMFIMPFLYWWLRSWKPFMIITTIIQIPFFLFSWKVIESPRWLLIEGKPESSIKELKKIAKANNEKLEENLQDELLTSSPVNKESLLGPLALFSGRAIAVTTILQLFLWAAVSVNYTVLMMSSGEKKDGNPFLEFAWQSIIEVPATFVAARLADKIGRRYTGAVSYSLCGLLWVVTVCRESGSDTWLQLWWVGSALVILNRLSSTISFYLIYLLNMELYPTCLRQSGMSLGNVFSSGASAVGPYLMYAGRRMDSRIPGAVLAVTAFFGLLSSIALPETLNTELPETLADAQDFGKNKSTYKSIKLSVLKKKTQLQKQSYENRHHIPC